MPLGVGGRMMEVCPACVAAWGEFRRMLQQAGPLARDLRLNLEDGPVAAQASLQHLLRMGKLQKAQEALPTEQELNINLG